MISATRYEYTEFAGLPTARRANFAVPRQLAGRRNFYGYSADFIDSQHLGPRLLPAFHDTWMGKSESVFEST